MKTKVITYTTDGNRLTPRFFELTPIEGIENAFYCLLNPDETDDFNRQYSIVLCWKGVHFEVERRYGFEDVEMLSAEMVERWIKNNLSDEALLSDETYTRLMEIEVVIQSGTKTDEFIQKIWASRREYTKRQDEQRADERKQEAERREQEKIENERKEAADLEKAEKDYISGASISPEMFVKLAEKHGVTVPIRTKGLLFGGRIACIYDKGFRYYKSKGDKNPSTIGICMVKKELHSILGIEY